MATCLKFLAFFVLVPALTEGKLDIKCIQGRLQEVPISYYGFGNIYSPGYTEGRPYPSNMACQVNLVADEEKHIRLKFNYIDIANNLVCETERLIVIDTRPDSSQFIAGMYCGNLRLPDYVSTGNTLQIAFQTSHVGSGLGFNITYREVSSPDLCKSGEFECRNRRCIPDENILCNGEDDCGDATDEENCDYPAPAPSKCGVPSVEPFTGNAMVDRIVGGREAVRGSWPWQVDMQAAYMQPNGHHCGGTLINSEWFITAAHCLSPLRSPYEIRVHLGNHHKYKVDPYEEIRYVKKYFIYGVQIEDFLENGEFIMAHDIALGKLNAPVLMNPHIQAACLPQPNEELKVGEKCFATGWGTTRGTGLDHVLKQAEHPIQNGTKCNNYRTYTFENESMICAGHLKRLYGLCHGDSGGPLVCKKDGKWFVHGATSFGDDNYEEGLCGLDNKPTVFSKVSSKVNWIQTIISNNS